MGPLTRSCISLQKCCLGAAAALATGAALGHEPHGGEVLARSGEAADSLVQLRLTLARRSSAGSSATASTCGGAQRGNPNPYPPHTNTLHEPELLCPYYLTYEWFVSHRFCADSDDDTLMQPSPFLYSTRRSSRRTGGLAALGGVDGRRG